MLAALAIGLTLKYTTNALESYPALKALFFVPVLLCGHRILQIVMAGNKYRPLEGKLDGYIIFEKDVIRIDTVNYNLGDIASIEFKGRDYLGLEIGYSSMSNYFEEPLSQGVDNTLVLQMNDGRSVKTKFQVLKSCEFREIEDVMLHYYLNDKLSYLQTVEVLGLSSQEEWNRLKELKFR